MEKPFHQIPPPRSLMAADGDAATPETPYCYSLPLTFYRQHSPATHAQSRPTRRLETTYKLVDSRDDTNTQHFPDHLPSGVDKRVSRTLPDDGSPAQCRERDPNRRVRRTTSRADFQK